MARAAAVFALLGLALSFVAPAAAGPFEDGLTAYSRNDFSGALRLWQPLANQGNAAAQANLALMYFKGQGVPRDYPRAYMWSSLAATRGHQEGAKNRDSIAKGMTPAQIAEGQKLAREWKPR